MKLSDQALDEAIRAADPIDAGELSASASSERASEARARIVRTSPGIRGSLPHAGRLLVGTGAILAIGAVLGALIVAVPSDPSPTQSGLSGDAPGSTVPNGASPAPPVGPGEPGIELPSVRTGRGAAVATPPAGTRTAAGIALLEKPGLARAEIPVELLRGDYCQIYADRVHRIAAIPTGGAVYLAWGPDDQVTWVTLGTRNSDGGGCSSATEVHDRQAIVLAPDVGPTITGSGPNAQPIRPDLPRYFVGFALDGYASAEADGVTVPIRDNVFVIETTRPRGSLHLTLRGPVGVHRETVRFAIP